MISTNSDIVHLSGQELYDHALKARKVISGKFLGTQIGRVIYKEEVITPKKRIASILGISPNNIKKDVDYAYIEDRLRGTDLNIDEIKSIIGDLDKALRTADSDFTKIAYTRYDGKYEYILNDLYESTENSDTETIFNIKYLRVPLEKSGYKHYDTGLGRLYDMGAIGLSPRRFPRKEAHMKKKCYLREAWKYLYLRF